MSLLDKIANMGSDESENDDDYVPSGGDESEEASDAAVSEDGLEVSAPKSSKKKTKTKKIEKRKRKGGIKLEGDEEEKVEDEEEDDLTDAQQPSIESVEKKKERANSLWADFLKDVEPPPKSKKETPLPLSEKEEQPEKEAEITPKSPVETPKVEKIKVTKEYDFAGETVRVTEEVVATPKTAKSLNVPSSSAKINTPPVSVKRKGGLGNILGQLSQKKQKMSTLTKSSLDWQQFKAEEGISEELEQFNRGKNGYLQKQDFLQKVDLNQFEIEKKMREKTRSSRLS